MTNNYVAEYVSNIKGKAVITLDKKISSQDLKMNYVIINGLKLEYSLSHSEEIIIVNAPNFEIQGKEVVFV